MNKSFIHKDITCKRLRASGLTKEQSLSILDEIEKWNRCNGSSWTVNRLKLYKLAYIRRLAGEEDIWLHSSWIKHTKDAPCGAFKRIFSMKKVQKALSALMVYSSAVEKHVTDSQWKKFKSAVEKQPEVDINWKDLRSKPLAKGGFADIVSMAKANKYGMFISLVYCQTRYSRSKSFLDSSYCEKGNYISWLVNPEKQAKFEEKKQNYLCNAKFDSLETWFRTEKRTPIVKWLYSKEKSGYIPHVVSGDGTTENTIESLSHPIFGKYLASVQNRNIANDEVLDTVKTKNAIQGTWSETDFPCGKIGFIQEPGNKLRSVALPFASLQWASSRLGNFLYERLRNQPNDCTFDQDQGVREIQLWLAKGNSLSSLDLSNATDTFPIHLTLAMLEGMGVDETDIDLFHDIARSTWALPAKEKALKGQKFIQWTSGQPLGLYPSFAAFALSHHMVVQLAQPTFYRILGDDIVIDPEAGNRLQNIYKTLGCKIAIEKSIVNSNKLAEFGGRLITDKHIYIQPKWKQLSDRSFIELARNLGPSSFGMFSPKQQKIIRVLDHVVPSIFPFGLNWNTRGLSYEFRYKLSTILADKMMEKTTLLANQFDPYSWEFSMVSKSQDEFAIKYHTTNKIERNEPVNVTSEEKLLMNLCVTHIDVLDDIIQDFKLFHPISVDRTGDPRGTSTLETMQKILHDQDVKRVVREFRQTDRSM